MRPRGRQRRGAGPKQDPAIGRLLDVEIDRIGKSGDGIASHEGRPVYVPFALPGDRMSIRLKVLRGDGYAAEIVEGRDLMPRQQPACRHFSACGGCRLQHMPMPLYRDWKRDQVGAALKARGIEGIEIRPMIDGQSATRRRLRLAFTGRGERVVLGHRRRERHEIVPLSMCPIALPSIVALFAPLRAALARLDMTKSGGELSITATQSGLDLLLESAGGLTLADREGLAALAEQENLARIAWRPDARSEAEPIAARREVMVRFGKVPAILSPGAFLQATEAAERAIVKAVAAIVEEAGEGAGRMADLFSGCGAIGLPLAQEKRTIRAFERDSRMVQTLNSAARGFGLAASITAAGRDLEREPLAADELRGFDALIIDPPRAGARPQIEAIAAARAPGIVAMVSCNPATFARDARLLLDAGYRLAWVQSIDAFLYSAEIELVGAFALAKAS